MNIDTEHRRRQALGLVLVAIAIAAYSLWRAGSRNVFPPGWWRVW
jgi:hypothetical protein